MAAVRTDPLALDPSRRSAKVTRELTERLALFAKLSEKAGDDPASFQPMIEALRDERSRPRLRQRRFLFERTLT